MTAYYNEIDPYAAQWLRNLIAAGHIAPGDVDERSIKDVQSDDLKGYTQCHFFAGIGVWSHALRLAGWPDDRPVWTGSCPCQPFSAAGKQGGFDDERHLWPEFFRLIREREPVQIFGEQVASKDGLAWLDLVFADLEGAGYAVGAADMCAAGVGAPHIRQRLWIGAERLEHSALDGRIERRAESGRRGVAGRCGNGRLGHAQQHRLEGYAGHGDGTRGRQEQAGSASAASDVGGLANANEVGHDRSGSRSAGRNEPSHGGNNGRPGPTNGFWRAADWLGCRDGKWRPVEPGTFPLAHGATSRVGRLRAYGNAIVPQVAAEFIQAFDGR